MTKADACIHQRLADCAGPRFPLGDVLAAFVLVFGGAFMIGFATLIGG